MKRQTERVELNHVITGATLVALVDGATVTPLMSGSDATESNVVSTDATPVIFARQFELKLSDMCGVLRKVS
jgi:hypothetical protein